MARITFSPLVAGASGKAADAVFSNWKGRAYVRKLVKPANPNTAAQQTVRESLGRLPKLWRSLESQVRAVQDTYAAAYGMSGYNWFVGQNRVLEETYETQHVGPPNVDIDKPSTFNLTDLGGGSCKVDWDGSTEGADYKVYILSRKIESGDVEDVFTLEEKDTTLASAHTVNVTLAASKDYEVILLVEDTVNNLFSQSVGDKITMGV